MSQKLDTEIEAAKAELEDVIARDIDDGINVYSSSYAGGYLDGLEWAKILLIGE